MNIVVTGATGLVGTELVTELLRYGHVVTALVRDPKAAENKFGNKLRCAPWDGETQTAPVEIMRQAEAVIHLAGENVAAHRWSKARKQKLRDSRVVSAQNLRRGLGDHRLKVFITASGVGYYGNRGDQKLSENDGPGDDFLAQLCVNWEAAADQIPAARVVKCRFGAVLAKGKGFLGQVVPLFKRFGASRLGDGHQWMTWVHIDDLVDVLMQSLIDDRLAGAVNVTAPQAVTNQTMTDELRKVLRTWRGPPAPKLALRLMYGELADALLYSQRAQPKKLEEARFKFEYPELHEALVDILDP